MKERTVRALARLLVFGTVLLGCADSTTLPNLDDSDPREDEPVDPTMFAVSAASSDGGGILYAVDTRRDEVEELRRWSTAVAGMGMILGRLWVTLDDSDGRIELLSLAGELDRAEEVPGGETALAIVPRDRESRLSFVVAEGGVVYPFDVLGAWGDPIQLDTPVGWASDEDEAVFVSLAGGTIVRVEGFESLEVDTLAVTPDDCVNPGSLTFRPQTGYLHVLCRGSDTEAGGLLTLSAGDGTVVNLLRVPGRLGGRDAAPAGPLRSDEMTDLLGGGLGLSRGPEIVEVDPETGEIDRVVTLVGGEEISALEYFPVANFVLGRLDSAADSELGGFFAIHDLEGIERRRFGEGAVGPFFVVPAS